MSARGLALADADDLAGDGDVGLEEADAHAAAELRAEPARADQQAVGGVRRGERGIGHLQEYPDRGKVDDLRAVRGVVGVDLDRLLALDAHGAAAVGAGPLAEHLGHLLLDVVGRELLESEALPLLARERARVAARDEHRAGVLLGAAGDADHFGLERDVLGEADLETLAELLGDALGEEHHVVGLGERDEPVVGHPQQDAGPRDVHGLAREPAAAAGDLDRVRDVEPLPEATTLAYARGRPVSLQFVHGCAARGEYRHSGPAV